MTKLNVIATFILLVTLTTSNLLSVEYIVKINISKKANSTQSSYDLEQIFNSNTNDKKNKLNSLNFEKNIELGKYFRVNLDPKQVNEFQNAFDVISITPNYKYKIETDPIPNDPKFSSQWALSYLNIRDAWEKATGKDIIIGIIDTGTDFNHEDLEGQLWVNPLEDINNNGTFEPWAFDEEIDGLTGDFDFIDNDGNGYADDVIGFDFVNVSTGNVGDDSDPDPIPMDENSHGTNMAGIIGAKHNNSKGISGVAYDARIMTIRAFDISGAGESDDIAAAIVYAVNNGAKVLNFSWGEEYFSPILHDAIKYAFANNVTMVSSSGNNNWYREHFPSDLEEVISVGGITNKIQKSGISNYGNRIDFLAPGQSVATLEPNNGYADKSGTSVAAPHVTSAAAMILEQNPNLSPKQIKFLLESTANDDDEFIGWDVFYGKGIMNINSALESNTNGTVSITYPEHNSAINTTDFKKIPIVGTVSHPLMRNYSLYVRRGRNPFNEPDFRSNEPFVEWTSASERMYEQVVNDTIALLDKSLFKDSIYTVRLKIDLINNSSFEQRFYFRPYTQSIFTKNRFTEQPKTLTFFDKDKKKIMVTATTKYESDFYVEVYNQSNELINTYSEVERSSLDHSVEIDDIPLNESFKYIAFAVATDDTVVTNGNLPILTDNVSTSAFVQKPYRLDGLYLHNNTYDDNNISFAATNLIGVNYIGTSFYEFDNGNFKKTDSISNPRLVIGYGDSNGDGKREILTSGNGELLLYEEDSKSKFGKTLFQINDRIIWPTDFVDIDNDGKDEIIAHNDTSYFVFDFSNGKYEEKNEIDIPIEIGRFDNFMSTIITNIDDDPAIEFVFTNSIGVIFIYEYINGQFVKEFENLVAISTSSQHLCAADIDADGTNEIVILNAGYQIPYNNDSGKELIWTAQIWDFINGTFQKIWEEHFSGVKFGSVNLNNDSYKNGVSCGDLDGIPGDEIIISPFPDLYVFKYDKGEIKPIWFYEFALTNGAIVNDFDGNNRNELGFNTIFGTRFFEMSDNELVVNAPANFDGRPLNQNTVSLSWDYEPNADNYLIYRLINPNTGQGQLYGSISNNKITFDTLQNFTWYDFFIVSENSDGVMSNSASNLVSCFTHPVANVIKSEFVSANIIEVTFDTRMPDYELEPRIFTLSDNEKDYLPNNVISSQDRRLRLIFNEPIFAGSYILKIPSIEDYYRQFTNEYYEEINSNYDGEPLELYFTSGEVINDKLLVKFSEAIDNSALNISNYTFLPNGNITDIVYGENPNEILITTDAFSEDALGFKFTLTGSQDIVSTSGNSMTKRAGNTLQFTFFKENLDKIFAYPQPVKLSKDEFLTFANLTSNATIYIYNNRSEFVKSITEFDGDGGAKWNMLDNNGNKLKSGVYYFKVEGSNADNSQEQVKTKLQNSELKKFMIID